MELYRTNTSNPGNAVLLAIASYAYCFYFIKEIRKGILRVIFLLPVFYTLSIIPWYFTTSAFLRAIASFFITWLASFKLLLFSFDKGDLSPCNNCIDFAIVTNLPAKFKEKSALVTNPWLNSHVLLKVVGLLTLPYMTFIFFQNMGVLLLPSEVASFMGHLILGSSIFGLPHMMPHLEFVPISNKPYLATSLKDFWGKRWNRISSNILRATIYVPTRNALKSLDGTVGPTTVRLVAVVVTLVVSGMMHEVVFYYFTCGKKPSWEMTWYFVMQAVCMGAEAVLKWWWFRVRRWPALHPVFSRVLTLVFVCGSAYRLLLIPILRSEKSVCVNLDLNRGFVV